MSLEKINKNITDLEKQLSQIETTILDSIERIERKKELVRKIKKLTKTKTQIEQLEQEQKELESLKSEFSQNTIVLNEQILNNSESGEVITVESEVNHIDKVKLTQPSFTNSFQAESNNQDKLSAFSNKIQLLLILGLLLSTVISITFIINLNSTRKLEQARLQELARQQVIIAQQEAEKARQEQAKVEREKHKAIQAQQEAEKAKQAAIKAQREERKRFEAYNRKESNISYSTQQKTIDLNNSKKEVGEPTVYNLDRNSNSYSPQNYQINNSESYQEIDETNSITLITRLYDLLSQKNFAEAELLYNPQLSYQFNSNFFSQFARVTVEDLRITSKTENSINFVGQNTYSWQDGSTQKELRSYQVKMLAGELKVTDSQFIKVTKFR